MRERQKSILRCIPKELYKDYTNKERIVALIDTIPDTDLHIKGKKNWDDDFIREVRDMGEDRVADCFMSPCKFLL